MYTQTLTLGTTGRHAKQTHSMQMEFPLFNDFISAVDTENTMYTQTLLLGTTVRRVKRTHPIQMELPLFDGYVSHMDTGDTGREEGISKDAACSLDGRGGLVDLMNGFYTRAGLEEKTDTNNVESNEIKINKKLGRPVNEEKQYAKSEEGREMLKRVTETVYADYRKMVKAEKRSDSIAEFASELLEFVGSTFTIATEKGPKTYKIKQITKSGTIQACIHAVYVANDGREMYRESFKVVEIFELYEKGDFEIIVEDEGMEISA